MDKRIEDERVSVNFACQRCLQPILLDDSFSRIDVHATAELECNFLCLILSSSRKNVKVLDTFSIFLCFSANLRKRGR